MNGNKSQSRECNEGRRSTMMMMMMMLESEIIFYFDIQRANAISLNAGVVESFKQLMVVVAD
jgi:hypothetical protein